MTIKFYSILLALSLISFHGIAQNQLTAERKKVINEVTETLLQKGIALSEIALSNEGAVKIARFRADTAPQLFSNAKAVLNNILPIRSNDELRAMEIIPDSGNYTFQQYEQYYKGIPVKGGVYCISAKSNVIQSAYGNFYPVGEVDVTPQITEKQALQYAMDAIGAELYAWQDSLAEAKMRENFGASYYPQGNLEVVKVPNDSIYRLAYRFAIAALQPFSDDLVYIDAITGKIIEKTNQIMHCQNTSGTAQTWYSGTKQITTDRFQVSGINKYRLREWRNGGLFGNV